MAESIDHSDSTEFMSDEPRTLEDFEASCEEFDVSDDEDFGHKENSFLDITIIATIRQDLVNLRRASSLSAVDAVIPTPPTALNISTLIGQLFCCDDSIIVKAVTVLASAAREPNGRVYVTRGTPAIERCSKLLPNQNRLLAKELLRFFNNVCADMAVNREKVVKIPGLMENIVRYIGHTDRTLGLFALSATQNIIRRNRAAQQKVRSQRILSYLVWLFQATLGSRHREINPNVVTELMWTLVSQTRATASNAVAFMGLVDILLKEPSNEDLLPLYTLLSRMLGRQRWQAMIARDRQGDKEGPSRIQLLWQLRSRIPRHESLSDAELDADANSLAFKNARDKIFSGLRNVVIRSEFCHVFSPYSKTVSSLIEGLGTLDDEKSQEDLLVILGDYAGTDQLCSTLVQHTPTLKYTIDIVAVSTDEAVLLAGFHLMRRLLKANPIKTPPDPERLTQLVMIKGLDHRTHDRLREGCLRLVFALLKASEKAPGELLDDVSTGNGRRFYSFLWVVFDDPTTTNVNKMWAARCCTWFLVRLLEEDLALKDRYQQQQQQAWSRFSDPMEHLLSLDMGLWGEVWLALSKLSESQVSDETVLHVLGKALICRSLVESALSRDKALSSVRSNALVLADQVARMEGESHEKRRAWYREVVQSPQTVEYHMEQANHLYGSFS